MLLFFPVPLNNTVSYLKYNGMFRFLFVVDNNWRRENDKLVVFDRRAFVLEYLRSVVCGVILRRLAN